MSHSCEVPGGDRGGGRAGVSVSWGQLQFGKMRELWRRWCGWLPNNVTCQTPRDIHWKTVKMVNIVDFMYVLPQ